MAETARVLMGTWEIQHYLGFYDATGATLSDYLRVTEDTKADVKSDDSEYKPKYLDRKDMPKYVTGRTTTIDFELDAVIPGAVQSKLAEHEDDVNVPCSYMRTINYDVTTGVKCASTALVAKRAAATITPDPISGDSGDPAKLSGTVTITGDWEYGTYDSETKKFTPKTA
jgi:hypothetical protein